MRLSVVTPVFDETDSVRELCQGLAAMLGDDLLELFIIIAAQSSPASFDACLGEARKRPGVVKVVLQKGPRGIGIPYREGISYCRGTHILCIDSGGEMELGTVSAMKALLAKDLADVAVASRWVKGGGFSGYGRLKRILNWGYQQFFRLLFRTPLHDLTYGFKMFRADLAQRLPFTGIRHEFGCEGTLLPVRLGFRVVEVPSRWTCRKQGRTKNRFVDNFRYVRMACRLLGKVPPLLQEPSRTEPSILP